MNKRLYDFTLANAIITIIAYAFLLILTGFSLNNKGKLNVVALIIMILLVLSFVFIVWYFVHMAVRVTDSGITHGKKSIDRKDCKYAIEYNPRFKVTEIIFYNKYHNIEAMKPKELRKKIITVQHSNAYEEFVEEYFKEKGTNKHEGKR